MQLPILATKLFVPQPPPQIIPRARLIKRLKNAQTDKLTLVAAPAGFGKTTLVSTWVFQQTAPVVWYSLDEGDNDPTRFFTYLCTALQRVNAHVGQQSLALLQSSDLYPGSTIITYLINDLIQVEQPLIIILDDYHVIQSDEIHSAIMYLIDNLLPHHHFIVISRAEPPLAVPRLRGKRRLTEITAVDLRTNQTETEFFFNKLLHLNLSPENIQEIDKQTEGWLTGLHLTALSIKDQDEATNLVHKIRGSDKFIADYLVEEVLAQQPEHIQQFLLNTSILKRLTPDLCNHINGIGNSHELLEQIEKANLFLIPLDNNRHWYRYHHLFAELLQSHLPQEKTKSLTYLAHHWHKDRGDWEEAITYALAGGHCDAAADIIEAVGNNIYWLRHRQTVQSWLESFPDSILRRRPHLWIIYGYGQIDLGNLQAMEVTMLQIEAHLNQHPANTLEEQVILEGKLAALKTAVYYHRALTPEVGIQAANTALANLSNSYYFYRTTAYFHGGGFLIMLGDLKKASDFLNEALTMSNQLSNPAARNLTIGNLGLLEFIAGNLNIAQDYFTELYNASRPTINRYGNIYANALTGLAAIYFEWNQLNTAFQYIKEGLHMAEQEGFLDRTLFCYQNYVYFLIACHKYKNANEILQQAKQYANHYNAPRFFTNRIEALSAQLYLYSGHLPQAIIWADTFAAEHEKQPIFLIESEHLLLARIRIAQQQYQEAITLLIQLLKLAEQQTRNRSVIVIKILLAKAYALTGDNMQAVAHLQHALNLAQPERYIRSFVDEGKPIQTLLQQMKTNNLQEESASYIQTVLHSFDPIHEQPTWQASSKNVNTVHLTKRELEVLTHLAQGSTYGESAIALTISKNTLSHHIKNIYRKLKVNNRLQAVSKAQKLNILPE